MRAGSYLSRRRLRPVTSGQDGFTLVELLVVLAIIALIAGLAAPQVLRYLGSARSDAAQAQIRNIESALELFYIDNLRRPTNEEGLAVLNEPTPELQARWNGPYLKNAGSLKDPWGNPYIYRVTDSGVEIISYGRDAKAGGTGEDRDISNR
nr:type II secretion system major pseudopilin GspG [Mesorhizobium sp.]